MQEESRSGACWVVSAHDEGEAGRRKERAKREEMKINTGPPKQLDNKQHETPLKTTV